MSSESIAAMRDNPSVQLQELADYHLQNDLQQSDRDALKKAANKISTQATIGSMIGVGLGIFLATRLRNNRIKVFEAFKAQKKPTYVKFADGHEEAVPDMAPLLKPTMWSDIATFTFFSIAGVFLGGEIGLLTGAYGARRSITKDPELRGRVEKAYRAFRADTLRLELSELESVDGEKSVEFLWKSKR